MPKGWKGCPDCGEPVSVRSKACSGCSRIMRGQGGRPKGSSSDKGFGVGRKGRRPTGTTATKGFGVSNGRPEGTTAKMGFGVSGGRPEGTTAKMGFGVSGGRPEGTTAKKGFSVSGGRPQGTSEGAVFKVGGQARPDSLKSELAQFSNSSTHLAGQTNLISGNGSSASFDDVNLSAKTLRWCMRRVVQQRRFDKQPLASALCWQCAIVLWSKVDSVHSCLVEPPPGMSEQDAPASAYLKAVPNCRLTFVKRSKSEYDSPHRPKWYACGHCRSNQISTQLHVGEVFDSDLTHPRPVPKWDTCKPEPVAALRNTYETGQVSLTGLFSTTVRDAGFAQWKHVQGEVNAMHKLDRHYYGLFGFVACKEKSIEASSSNPESSLRIHRALKWFKDHNSLYQTFFPHYKTLFRSVKPGFVNPELLECQDIPLQELLQDELVGMAFPVDLRYYDQFPLIYGEDEADIAGLQHPQNAASQCRESLRDLVHTQYGERDLEPKAFPHLHPWGYGGWYYKCELSFSPPIKMCLFDVREWYAEDPHYAFFKFDYMTKRLLRG